MVKKQVFVVDDEPNVGKLITHWIQNDDFEVRTFENGESFLSALEICDKSPDVVCLDMIMPGMDGIEVLERIQSRLQDFPVIMVTAADSLEVAVQAMKLGAYDYISKPIDLHRLSTAIKKAVEKNSLSKEVRQLRRALDRTYSFDNIIGKSSVMEIVFKKIEKVLDNDINIFIHGESGTGKELVAKAIHYQGHRKKSSFEAVNCGAIPENLQESELFGHEKGAFTGAVSTHAGKIEQTKGGTLFLDEVGEMPQTLQVKLLRFLQEKTFKRVGGTSFLEADVRIVSATNKDLLTEVKLGNFREDLYYRLVVYPVNIPPLRERKEDIPALVRYFVKKYINETGKEIFPVASNVMDIFMNYSWPGNVRELENVIFRAVVTSEHGRVEPDGLPQEILQFVNNKNDSLVSPPTENLTNNNDIIFPETIVTMRDLEKKAILHALSVTKGNLSLAAKKMEIGRATFYRKIDKYNLYESSPFLKQKENPTQ